MTFSNFPQAQRVRAKAVLLLVCSQIRRRNEMEEAASVSLDPFFVSDGWFSDVDDGSSPPAAKTKKLSLSLSEKTAQSSHYEYFV